MTTGGGDSDSLPSSFNNEDYRLPQMLQPDSTKTSPSSTVSPTESESHRIYWQQWLSSNEKSLGSRREWVTSSAAVRISPVARASDVTGLLRESLQLSPLESTAGSDVGTDTDALVLVGTLYSLSRDYVRFEHEHGLDKHHNQHHKSASSSGPAESNGPLMNRSMTAANGSTSSPSSDAFNIIHTLKPSDFPLQVRDRMANHLRQLQTEAVVGRTIIAPKLQWYYCPVLQSTSTIDNNSSIPSCINLEGYCTSMEEDLDDWGYDDDEDNGQIINAEKYGGDDDENDSIDAASIGDFDLLESRFPWLKEENSAALSRHSAETSPRHANLKKQFRREHRRLNVLAAYVSSVPQGTLSGFLLKRSSKDIHVWRRVHCVLTDDYLWFVSRRYSKGDYTFAKHGRVRLTRALILEPSADYPPLYRTPHAFEMVAADGTCHIFRAANRPLQRKWIKVISDRIIQSYENSLLDSAQLIVNDECVAQARHIDNSMDKFWERLSDDSTCRNSKRSSLVQDRSSAITSPAVARVLRWSLKVADFRHFCRHVRTTLPAKSPVVVTSPSNLGRTTSLKREISSDRMVPLDPLIQSMIRAAWQQAATLLQQATVVAQYLSRNHAHRNLETLLRHVEFVITGRHSSRSMEGNDNNMTSYYASLSNSSYNDRAEPPPMELMDALEKELQTISASIAPE